MTENIELASAITNLRQQLQEAIKEGDGKDLRFAVQGIEVELKCLVKSEGSGGVGAKFWVINAEAKGMHSREVVQTVKLKLLPIGEDGEIQCLSDVGKS